MFLQNPGFSRIFFATNCSFVHMFANSYLAKNNHIRAVSDTVKPETGIIVVIPCHREPEIQQTLQSLKECHKPTIHVEVIILVNHSEIATEEVKSYNKKTCLELDSWIKDNNVAGITFFAVGPVELKKKWAGAGLARKKGMDEAVSRFNQMDKPEGIIVSLDADTLVDRNYLLTLETYFSQNSKAIGATIAFEHQKCNLPQKQEEGINLYEKYLKYYKQALEYTGYPHAMFTIGSAFAVRALAYVKRGGMNRRQAGEDFYFLQNLAQMGELGEIKNTKVYPSARLSDRVPFGTGPILQKWMRGEEDLSISYNFNAFKDLKVLFDLREKFFDRNEEDVRAVLATLPELIRKFVEHDNFMDELQDLNKNCSTISTYHSRFFQKFNAFKILKYLNFAHETCYQKEDLEEQLLMLGKEQQA